MNLLEYEHHANDNCTGTLPSLTPVVYRTRFKGKKIAEKIDEKSYEPQGVVFVVVESVPN